MMVLRCHGRATKFAQSSNFVLGRLLRQEEEEEEEVVVMSGRVYGFTGL